MQNHMIAWSPLPSSISNQRTKRLSPYSETKIWEKDELFTIIKYETNTRNKAIVALMWDLDARPSEIVLLKFVCIFNAFTNKKSIPYF